MPLISFLCILFPCSFLMLFDVGTDIKNNRYWLSTNFICQEVCLHLSFFVCQIYHNNSARRLIELQAPLHKDWRERVICWTSQCQWRLRWASCQLWLLRATRSGSLYFVLKGSFRPLCSWGFQPATLGERAGKECGQLALGGYWGPVVVVCTTLSTHLGAQLEDFILTRSAVGDILFPPFLLLSCNTPIFHLWNGKHMSVYSYSLTFFISSVWGWVSLRGRCRGPLSILGLSVAEDSGHTRLWGMCAISCVLENTTETSLHS